MKNLGKFAFAAALLLGASSAGFAGDGYPNTNYPSAYGRDNAAIQAPVVRGATVRATDAFAWERGARPSLRQEQRQQDRQTDNVNNN